MLAQTLCVLPLGLLLVLMLLKLHRLHLSSISVVDQRIVGDCQRSQVSRVRLASDERVRSRLKTMLSILPRRESQRKVRIEKNVNSTTKALLGCTVMTLLGTSAELRPFCEPRGNTTSRVAMHGWGIPNSWRQKFKTKSSFSGTKRNIIVLRHSMRSILLQHSFENWFCKDNTKPRAR